MMAADAALLFFAAWLSFALRFNTAVIPKPAQVFLLAAAPATALPLFLWLGIYRSIIRFIDDQALQAGARAMAVASILWAAVAFLTEKTGGDGLPRSVPFIYFVLGTLFLAAARVAARWLSRHLSHPKGAERNALIVGAGDAGRQLAASLRESHDLRAVAFIDHDQRMHGTLIGGLPVFAPTRLSSVIESRNIKDVIIAWPSVPSAHRADILERLRREPVRTRSLPAFSAIASGRHLVSLIREVDVVDVLGRPPIAPRAELLRHSITGKTVLVTGAGGSIGSELCRQIALLAPERLIMLEISEHALYNVQREVAPIAECEISSYLGSVTDDGLVNRIFSQHKIETVYHAAAHKHVPIVEENALEGIRNNVFGTQVLALAAYRAGVESFVLVSTDKAVRPTNVMGATKRWAELIVQALAAQAIEEDRQTCFCAVRFGNVLCSSGSVIPLFKEQIAQGGPVTVTHADMTRYFMSIQEAVGLLVQAVALASGGEVFLLDMGQPIRIVDLARNMIELSGHTVRDADHPDGEIEIALIGVRPGEKIHEELLISDEGTHRTVHEKIIVGNEPRLASSFLTPNLARLAVLLERGDALSARDLLLALATEETAAAYERSDTAAAAD